MDEPHGDYRNYSGGAQLDQEKERAEDLEEYKVYVKTKQYAEEVAKERLGLVNPDEILLKPEDEN